MWLLLPILSEQYDEDEEDDEGDDGEALPLAFRPKESFADKMQNRPLQLRLSLMEPLLNMISSTYTFLTTWWEW